ncbi:DUF4136 domain-containing protein [Colwelliaceae bacterium BS250]
MKLHLIIMLLLLSFVSACSTNYIVESDYKEDFDFSKVGTYYLVESDITKNIKVSELDKDRIDKAIKNEFKNKKKIPVKKEDADVLVSYFIITKDNLEVNAFNGGYSHLGGYGTGLHEVNVKQYTEGTLVIDFIDNDSKKLVWRSSVSKPLKNKGTPEQRQQIVQEVIAAMTIMMPI